MRVACAHLLLGGCGHLPLPHHLHAQVRHLAAPRAHLTQLRHLQLRLRLRRASPHMNAMVNVQCLFLSSVTRNIHYSAAPYMTLSATSSKVGAESIHAATSHALRCQTWCALSCVCATARSMRPSPPGSGPLQLSAGTGGAPPAPAGAPPCWMRRPTQLQGQRHAL